jgi:hypothetical protein
MLKFPTVPIDPKSTQSTIVKQAWAAKSSPFKFFTLCKGAIYICMIKKTKSTKSILFRKLKLC